LIDYSDKGRGTQQKRFNLIYLPARKNANALCPGNRQFCTYFVGSCKTPFAQTETRAPALSLVRWNTA